MQQLTNGDIFNIGSLYEKVSSRWDAGTDLTIQRFAIKQMADSIFPFYMEYIAKQNELSFKYIENDGQNIKYKAEIFDITGKKNTAKEPLWKDEKSKEKYLEEVRKFGEIKHEVNYKLFDIEQLLETKTKVGEEEVYQLLKYVTA